MSIKPDTSSASQAKTTEAAGVSPTPGPWRVVNEPVADDGHPDHWNRIVGDAGRHVAYVARGYSGDGPREDDWTKTHEANARLIAAAPDLLRDLRGVVYLFPLDNISKRDPRYELAVKALESARAAIAKAGGAK